MAMSRAMTKFGANPGRSGHAMSIAAAEEIFKCREAAVYFSMRMVLNAWYLH